MSLQISVFYLNIFMGSKLQKKNTFVNIFFDSQLFAIKVHNIYFEIFS